MSETPKEDPSHYIEPPSPTVSHNPAATFAASTTSDIRRDVYRLFRFGWRPISDREVRQQIRREGFIRLRGYNPASRPHGPASKMHSHDGYRKILDQEKHDDVSFTTVFHHRGHRGFSFFLNLRVLCVLCSEKSDFFAFQRSRTSFRDTYVHGESPFTICAPDRTLRHGSVPYGPEQLVTR